MRTSTMAPQIVAFLSIFLGLVIGHASNSKLLLISLDGFRHDYLELTAAANLPTPNFDKLRARGVSAEVQNIFTTKTLPTHYSIVTGLYQEHHGLVHNRFYDPVYNDTFGSHESKLDIKWYNGTDPTRLVEPIWITNQKSKQTLLQRRSGVYQWPGSEVAFHNRLPFHYEVYNSATSALPFDVRIQTVVNWFSNFEAPINFAALYFPEPDATGHKYGPNSREILDQIVKLDQGIGLLMSLLEKRNLSESMNIVITSDHGMAQMNRSKIIFLSDYLQNNTYKTYGGGILCHILPQPNNEANKKSIYDTLRTVPNLEVYLKEEVPPVYHYSSNRRIMPIIVVAKKGWMILRQRVSKLPYFNAGQHGFDNRDRDMHPFLIAAGPAFKKNYTSPKHVNQVDLYEIMCHILRIHPNPNDGVLDRVQHLLVDQGEQLEEEEYTLVTFLAVLMFTASISGICCVAVCRVYKVNIRRRRIPHHLMTIPVGRYDESATRLLNESDEEIP